MGLNIKTDEAHRLAHELAALTGETITTAVTQALRERLERVQRERAGLADRILAIGRNCAAQLKEPFRSGDVDELLYDEHGLPHGLIDDRR